MERAYVTYSQTDTEIALRLSGYKGDYEEVKQLHKDVTTTSNYRVTLTKKVHESFYLSTMMTSYSFLSTKRRMLYKKLINEYNMFVDPIVNSISYRKSIDDILLWRVFDWDVIEFMFMVMRCCIRTKRQGFVSKTEKGLIKDFAKAILYSPSNNTIYVEEFKEFILKEYGNEAKKILMELSLGGK